MAKPAIDAEPSALTQIRARGRVRGPVALLGPAFVAAVAYVDPGNFATNFTAGAQFGYTLVWVIVLANLMAMLVQYLSAKTGVATGKDLPELCREHFPRPVSRGLWVQAELIAMATDLAEFVGAAVGLNLLFGVPLFPAGLITAVVAFAILALEQRGYRRFELAIVALLALVFFGFLYDLLTVGTSVSGVVSGLVPSFSGSQSVVLAAGIIGATVMPHVVYLHSALTKNRVATRNDAERREVMRYQRFDVFVGLGMAGLINLSMLAIAASLFHAGGHTEVDSIEAAHAGLGQLIGGGAALAFAIALLASGLSSSSVGTYAGQVVMQGFIRRRIPLYLRRGLTMLPALVVLGLGLPTTDSLIVSQVVLSFGIPFALVPMVLLTRRRDVMGALVNRPITTFAAWVIAALIIALNVYLIGDTIFG
ncbi:Nramp family divalent metal transporter [Pseudonocardia spinosispora]|uniref:Nramp family divalent metal transporter n=1 Tax=Pseudonocardia spinosispora TaxID=103441 RepID=UPI0003FC8D9B|nr:Nramp family divalent metal transporter [Pseudonocardia spinosispora]